MQNLSVIPYSIVSEKYVPLKIAGSFTFPIAVAAAEYFISTFTWNVRPAKGNRGPRSIGRTAIAELS